MNVCLPATISIRTGEKFYGTSRREEIMLAYCRTGYTCFKKRKLSSVLTCNTPLAVEHVLVQCPVYGNICVHHCNVSWMNDLFKLIAGKPETSHV